MEAQNAITINDNKKAECIKLATDLVNRLQRLSNEDFFRLNEPTRRLVFNLREKLYQSSKEPEAIL